MDAGDLDLGDQLLSADGTTTAVSGLQGRTEVLTVHNLSVHGIETYYVEAGDQLVLVHNQSCVPRPRVKPKRPASPPSWVLQAGYTAWKSDVSPNAAATRIMNDRYPSGWDKGAGSEYSKLQKWLSRNFDWS